MIFCSVRRSRLLQYRFFGCKSVVSLLFCERGRQARKEQQEILAVTPVRIEGHAGKIVAKQF